MESSKAFDQISSGDETKPIPTSPLYFKRFLLFICTKIINPETKIVTKRRLF